jgi:hypothetical protein
MRHPRPDTLRFVTAWGHVRLRASVADAGGLTDRDNVLRYDIGTACHATSGSLSSRDANRGMRTIAATARVLFISRLAVPGDLHCHPALLPRRIAMAAKVNGGRTPGR